jgi:perosamine synthetase
MSQDIEFIPGARPTFLEQDLPGILDEIKEVLLGGRLILGPKLRRLEEAWAKRVGTKHAVGLSSCTAALEIAYRHLKVKGREVIVPTNTFVAMRERGRRRGSRREVLRHERRRLRHRRRRRAGPRDPQHGGDPGGAHLGLHQLEDRAPPRSVQIAWRRADRGLRPRARRDVEGREAGSLGDAGCFSLYPTKVLTCGVGGVLTTNDDELAAFARSLRHHGQGASLEEIENAGNDWMLDEVRAVIASEQLRRLDDFLAARRRVAKRYDELLAGNASIVPPKLHPAMSAAYYKYPVLLPEGTDARAIRKRLYEGDRIEIGSLYYPPCHLMPVFKKALGTGPGEHPKAEALLARQVCLPMHAQVTDAQAERSVKALERALAG